MKQEVCDTQWFCEQVRQCEASLYRTAVSLLNNREDAEDAIQEALYTAYKKRHTLRSPEKFKPWLLKILTNAAYDILRRRRPVISLEDAGPLASEPDPIRNLALAQVVAQLPPDYRQAVNLFYYEDLSIRQIAEITGYEENVIKTRLFRARQRLRVLLEESE